MMGCAIQACHLFIPFSSCSFWGLHSHALPLPSIFYISITNTYAEKEVDDLPHLWSMHHAEKDR